MLTDKAKISVVILTHNKLEVTRRCLPSLLQTQSDVPWELVVADNGSSDGSVAWLREFKRTADACGVRMTLIENNDNIGCSTSRNQGIEAASGDFIVFVDNDVALRSVRWLDQLRAVLDAEPTAGLVGPRLLYPTPPHNIQCAGVGISPNGRVLFRGRGEPRTMPDYGSRESVQALISACFMARADLLFEYGGFDEAFNPVEFEDFDLCYRIREKGWLAIYEPAVEMYHFESVTTQGTPNLPNTALIIRNGLKFKRRWKHMFAEEDGPPDEATRWRDVPPTDLKNLIELPTMPALGEKQWK